MKNIFYKVIRYSTRNFFNINLKNPSNLMKILFIFKTNVYK